MHGRRHHLPVAYCMVYSEEKPARAGKVYSSYPASRCRGNLKFTFVVASTRAEAVHDSKWNAGRPSRDGWFSLR